MVEKLNFSGWRGYIFSVAEDQSFRISFSITTLSNRNTITLGTFLNELKQVGCRKKDLDEAIKLFNAQRQGGAQRLSKSQILNKWEELGL